MTEEEVVRNTLIALDKSCPVCTGGEEDVHDGEDLTKACDKHLLECYDHLNLANYLSGCFSCRQLANEVKRRNL